MTHKRVRVRRKQLGRAGGIRYAWHWWCPECVGGDFEPGWRVALAAANSHARWHGHAEAASR